MYEINKELLIEIMDKFNLLEIQVENMLLDDNLIICKNVDDLKSYKDSIFFISKNGRIIINCRPEFSYLSDREDVINSINRIKKSL